MRVSIGVLTLDHGRLGYDDAGQKTSIRSEVSTADADATAKAGTPAGVAFNAEGLYKGLALKARGSGGPVLALRDESTPYPLKVDATIGPTGVRADGSITSLLKFSAMDMRLALRGASLAQLFPLLGIAFPETRAYATEGHLVHNAQTWRYEKFAGRIGESDIAGTLQVDTGGKRPAMQAELVSKLLVLEDLGPLIGARPGTVAKAAAAEARMLPDVPFSTERWDTVDADVKLSAKTIRRAKALPIENLVTHLKLRDSVLTLDPLNFGVAGGNLAAVISLDGRHDPIRAHAKVRAKKLALNKLFPTVDLTKTSVGQVDGEFDLAGNGNSVAHMLAAADGKVGLVIAGGEISNMMMEIVGLDLWEYLSFKVKGDKPTAIRCGVADFGVKGGVMQVNALVLDTVNTNVGGTGSIDLRNETLASDAQPAAQAQEPGRAARPDSHRRDPGQAGRAGGQGPDCRPRPRRDRACVRQSPARHHPADRDRTGPGQRLRATDSRRAAAGGESCADSAAPRERPACLAATLGGGNGGTSVPMFRANALPRRKRQRVLRAPSVPPGWPPRPRRRDPRRARWRPPRTRAMRAPGGLRCPRGMRAA